MCGAMGTEMMNLIRSSTEHKLLRQVTKTELDHLNAENSVLMTEMMNLISASAA